MLTRAWISAAALCAVGLWGCSAEPDASADPTSDYDTADTQEQRAASWERLVGAWRSTRAGQYTWLVFGRAAEDTGHSYFGMRVVTCVRAPCNPVREDGSYTAGTVLLTLRSGSATQRLRYRLAGDDLTVLSGEREIAWLRRADSYCTQPVDCRDQGLAQPRCIGSWVCSANACAYNCGRPDPCATTRCPAGQHCTAPADAPMCVPDVPGPTCATILCAPNTRCQTVDGRARCVPVTDPCATVRCAAGTHCVASGTTAACVADGGGYGATCGGIAGLRCAAGYTCVLDSRMPDATGICHAESPVGGPCGGGSIRYPAVCATGLRCVGPAAGAPIGATGTCTR